MPSDDHADRLVVGRMPGQPSRFAAVHGHDEDVSVPVVVSREGDPLAVGRDLGQVLRPGMGGQTAGRSAIDRRGPEIPLGREVDLTTGDLGKSQVTGPSERWGSQYGGYDQ